MGTRDQEPPWPLAARGGCRKKITELLSVAGFEALPITVAHALAAGFFAAEHRDPFDRMLMAQAAIEGLRLVSMDSAITALIAEVLW